MSTLFPFNRPDLLEKWIKYVNQPIWKPSKSSVVCVKHFKNELIIHGQRKKLKWKLQPVLTVHSNEAIKRPSTLPLLLYHGNYLNQECFEMMN